MRCLCKIFFIAIASFNSMLKLNAQEQYADVVIDSFYSGVTPGFDDFYGNNGGEGCNYVVVSPTVALGNDQNSFVSLPTGSYVTLGFTDNFIVNAPNQFDIFIDEVGAASEVADVFISSDFGASFTYFGEIDGGITNQLDLNDIGYADIVNAIKIVGKDSKGCVPGFDVVRVFGIEGANCENPTIIQSAPTLCINASNLQLDSLVTSNTGGYWSGEHLVNGNEFVPETVGLNQLQYISFNPISLCPNDTFDLSIDVSGLPSIDLGENIVLDSRRTVNLGTADQYFGYQWNTGETSRTITVDQVGTYSVEVENEFGCKASDNIRVDTLNISAANMCFGETNSFQLNTSLIDLLDSVLWNFGDGFSENLNPDHIFSVAGQKRISATVFYDGVQARTDTTLTVYALPSVNFGSDTTLFFKETLSLDATNVNSTYQWNDGSSDSVFLVSEPGEYSVLVTNEFGCLFLESIQVNYDQVIDVALGNDTTICLEASIELDLFQEGLTYEWSTGETSSSIVVSDSALIWVNIINAFGNRTLRDSIRISQKVFDTVLVEDTVICEPSDVLLTATGAGVGEFYNWYSSDQTFLEQTTGQFLTDEISSTQQFFVSLTDNNCESDWVSVAVIHEPPTASILNTDTILVVGESIQLKGAGGVLYEWNPSTYLDDPFVQNPTSKPPDNISYTLLVTDENGCTDETSINLTVQLALVYNNTFTPNGDGLNDTWIIRYLDRYPNHRVRIFDRLGNTLTQFEDYQNDWTGGANGKDLPPGTYFYWIDLGNGNHEKGSVTILR